MTRVSRARRGWGLLGMVLAGLCLPSEAAAQELLLPPTLLIPNYNRVFPGLDESIEAGASLARSGTPPALWYNPAGLVLSERTTVTQTYSPSFTLRSLASCWARRPSTSRTCASALG